MKMFKIISFVLFSMFVSKPLFAGFNADAWLKQEKLSEIEAYIVAGNKDQARIMADYMAEKYPDDIAFRDHAEKIFPADSSIHQSRQGIGANGDLMLEYRRCKEEGNISKARHILLMMMETNKKAESSIGSLEDELKSSDEAVARKISGDIALAKNEFERTREVADPQTKLSELSAIMNDLSRLLEHYPSYAPLMGFKEEVKGELDRAGRLALANADTVRRLSGCAPALEQYRRLIGILNEDLPDLLETAKERYDSCN